MLDVRLLGRFELRADGAPIDIPSLTTQSLMAFLVMHAGVPYRRVYLAGIIWPDVEESKARKYLRQALWRLRKAIGDSYIQSDRVSLNFDRDSPYHLDVNALDCTSSEAETVDGLINAVSKYRGMLLPGFYEDWVAPERERLLVIFDQKMKILLEKLLTERRWSDVVHWANHWIVHNQAIETAYQAMLRGYGEQDDIPAVIDTYRRCVQDMQSVYAVEPSIETQELFKLYSGKRETKGAPKGQEVEEIARWRHNLPPQPTPFVGREKALQQLKDLIQNPECRLLTLVGPGGIGKTRLAIQAAESIVEEYPNGVYFVPLVSIQSIHQIPIAIVNSLNLELRGQSNPLDQLIVATKEQHLLLLLDNFEHLIEGNELIARILRETDSCKFLITSRERLNLSTEWIYEVIGMEVPQTDHIDSVDEYSALKLFQKTYHRIQGGKSLEENNIVHAIEICKIVDGFPLGIELAVTATRISSCKEIAQRLKDNLDILTTEVQDLPSRHRSMKAAFEHSWGLLSDNEKTTLRRLSIFKGGFLLDAAVQVTGATYDVILSLSNKSLLKKSINNRLHIHELLRTFVFGKLKDYPKEMDDIYSAFCDYYTNYLDDSYELLHGEAQDLIIQKMKYEYENINYYWNLIIKNKDLQRIDSSMKGLRSFFDYLNLYHEGLKTIEKALNVINKIQESNESEFNLNEIHGVILGNIGWFTYRIGKLKNAEELLIKSILLLEPTNSLSRMSFAYHTLGIIYFLQGNFKQSLINVRESLKISREINSKVMIAARLNTLGLIHDAQGEYTLARKELEESIAITRESNDLKGLSRPISNLGLVHMHNFDCQVARRLLTESKALHTELNDKYGSLRTSINLAWIDIESGNYSGALNELLSIAYMIQNFNLKRLDSIFYTYLGEAYMGINDYVQGAINLTKGLSTSIEISLFPVVIESIIRTTILYRKRNIKDRSVELLSMAYHHPACAKDEQEKAKRLLNSLESELPPNIFKDHYELGKSLDLEKTAKKIIEEVKSLIDNHKENSC